MTIKLDRVVPFGRSLEEYRRLFNLATEDLDKKIIGIGDGPASFNAEMTAAGNTVLSVDPVYEFTASEIEARFYAVVDDIIQQVRQSPEDWVWHYHRSPDQLRANREAALKIFIRDYPQGKREGRYRPGNLPELKIEDGQFELALCSHLLFLYSDHLDYRFHRDAVFEMLRIAGEVRIFPLITLANTRSSHLDPLVQELRHSGYYAEIQAVSYELQKGGNQMLRILKP